LENTAWHTLIQALCCQESSLKGDLFDRSAYIADKARERAAGVVAFLRWFALGLRTGHALAAPDALLGLRCVPLRKREWVMPPIFNL